MKLEISRRSISANGKFTHSFFHTRRMPRPRALLLLSQSLKTQGFHRPTAVTQYLRSFSTTLRRRESLESIVRQDIKSLADIPRDIPYARTLPIAQSNQETIIPPTIKGSKLSFWKTSPVTWYYLAGIHLNIWGMNRTQFVLSFLY